MSPLITGILWGNYRWDSSAKGPVTLPFDICFEKSGGETAITWPNLD